ncbi:putative phospholipid-transporting atpase 1 protein [Botrytis cinerea BcDW1]|uniref:Phospholipid-transporting ATPase n=1 Tax=Botryotinia fuckeliana (strain BcDW1) TaxID=1290391 RepID=M7TPB5_BOTF1|nr:putative phospholipid-transporting atpase 1 protein [Botrytis cinerea BcDW1]
MATLTNEGDQSDGSHGNKPINKTKRSRWATRKLTVKSSQAKRLSLLSRTDNKRHSNENKKASGGSESLQQPNQGDGGPEEEETEDSKPGPRTLYFNLPLPDDLKDEDGEPAQTYARNKIRTAKYTPLSFIPKNLYFQFHNIANIFFLFITVLAFFSIFGVNNPGLNSAPLIFIIAITAVRDAIEDRRRTISDKQLNNSPVHRLCGWDNVNVKEDNVSSWRKTKKATSRFVDIIWHSIESLWKRKNQAMRASGIGHDGPRASIETTRTRPESIISPYTERLSFVSTREDIQMTPVPSPDPRPDQLQPQPQLQDPLEQPTSALSVQPSKVNIRTAKTDLINYDIQAPGKARFHRSTWKELQVGDFVRIYNDDEIPADVIILASSDPEGVCYVETKNLDGETNLKYRQALRCARSLKHAKDCERAQFRIESEAPQPNLYKYNAAIKWNQKIAGQSHEISEPITIDNVLLRGCNLRNTEWALGIVIFTGHDTKTMMNAGITPSKRARISRELNFNIICNFGVLFIMCLIAGIANGVAWGQNDASQHYFDFGSIGGSPSMSGFTTFWASIILFQNLVPLSLYISVEIMRTLQAVFIYSDREMWYDPIEQPCIPKSWNLSDDLGQIEYIFSDKTGTLTQNVMEFKKATINGRPYGEAYTEAQAGMQKRLGIDMEKEGELVRAEIAEAKVKVLKNLRELYANPYLHDEDLTFIAPDFVEDLSGKHGPEQQHATERFMLALALCHTVIAEEVPGDVMTFKAQSPDEAALVATARDMGFTVLGNTSEGINLNVMGEEKHYPILNVVEFNSSRKRMSAIVRMPDGKIVLFCKGADSVIYSRLRRGEQAELRKRTAEHLEIFAREGLRTLCIAERVLDEEEYYGWRKIHDAAATALEEREEKMEQAADLIEQEMTLLGGTAIEDRLQDGVPDTIALLGDAGIKLWVLTGDKVETAINIGFSCNLLNNDMELIRLRVEEDENGNTPDEEFIGLIRAELDKHLAVFNLTGSDQDLAEARRNHEPPGPTHGLVIDGFTLRWALCDELKQKFLLLCKQCKSVLCCRVSPAQKAAVCAMVKTGFDVMTLSVGDGANDVAMIQEADVGVGIAGVEGRQAVMSSDYAIGQFRFLQRLILVHGRWSYRRLAEAIIPVVLMGVFDQDVSDIVSLAVPQLYRRGIERLEWTQRKFWLYMVDGFYQSIMCFFIPYLTITNGPFASLNGLDVSERTRLGCYIAHPTVFTINLYILINLYRWDWLMLLVIAVSDLFIFFWTAVYGSNISAAAFYQAAPQVYGQLSFWAVMLVTPVVCILPRYAIKALQKVYWPYDVDIIREQVQQGKFDHLQPTKEAEEKGPKNIASMSLDPSNKGKHAQYPSVDEDRRPIYPPSVTTHNTRTQNGSDGTNSTNHNAPSVEMPVRTSIDRARPSYDRIRASMDQVRASYEASHDFTTAAGLTRIESSHSVNNSRSLAAAKSSRGFMLGPR